MATFPQWAQLASGLMNQGYSYEHVVGFIGPPPQQPAIMQSRDSRTMTAPAMAPAVSFADDPSSGSDYIQAHTLHGLVPPLPGTHYALRRPGPWQHFIDQQGQGRFTTLDGRRLLADTLAAYPYTPEMTADAYKASIVPGPMKQPGLMGQTDPTWDVINIKHGLGMPAATKILSHELLHNYLDQQSPVWTTPFEKHWAAARQQDPMMTAIDNWIHELPAYQDFDQERFAYLGEAYGAGGLGKIPAALRPDYAAVFRNISPAERLRMLLARPTVMGASNQW